MYVFWGVFMYVVCGVYIVFIWCGMYILCVGCMYVCGVSMCVMCSVYVCLWCVIVIMVSAGVRCQSCHTVEGRSCCYGGVCVCVLCICCLRQMLVGGAG